MEIVTDMQEIEEIKSKCHESIGQPADNAALLYIVTPNFVKNDFIQPAFVPSSLTEYIHKILTLIRQFFHGVSVLL